MAHNASSTSRGSRRSRDGFDGDSDGWWDRLGILLLFSSAVTGVLIFGGTRIWSSSVIGVLAMSGAALCLAGRFFSRSNRAPSWPPGGLILALFLAYLLWFLPRTAVPGAARHEWLKMGYLLMAYWCWREAGGKRNRWRWIMAGLLLLGSCLAWYALIQHAQGTRMVWMLERPEGYEMRASGTHMCPNHFAHLLAFLICVAMALVCVPSCGVTIRLLAGYGAAVMAPALYLTQSRSGWLGLLGGLFVTFCVLLWRRGKRYLLLGMVLLPLLLGGMALTVWKLSPMVQQRVEFTLRTIAQRGDRLMIWSDTLSLIRENPWIGHGPGTYRWLFPTHMQHAYHSRWVRYAHNEYLHAVAETGIIGLALLLAAGTVAGIWFLRRALQSEKGHQLAMAAGVLGAWAASLIHAFFDFNLHIMGNVMVLTLLTGLASGLFGEKKGSQPVRAWHPAMRRVLYGSAGLLVLALLVGLAQTLYAQAQIYRGHRLRAAWETDAALEAYRRAMRFDGGDAEPWLGAGHIFRSKAFWYRDPEARQRYGEKALEMYRQARLRNPADSEILYGKSRTLAALGYHEDALECLYTIIQHEPVSVFYRVQIGLQLRRMGRHAEALEVFEEAARMRSPGMEWRNVIQTNIRLLRKRLNGTP